MKKPNLKTLSIAEGETKKIRTAAAHSRSIKITININAEILAKLKKLANDSGIPYQRLLNRKLSESFATKDSQNSRLERLEQEMTALKRKLSA